MNYHRPAAATRATGPSPWSLLALAAISASAQAQPAGWRGLTADSVAELAVATSYSAAAAREALQAANARTDQARALFLPRLSGTARYARLSDFTQPPLAAAPATLVGTTAPAGTVNPTTAALPELRFGNILDNYFLVANLGVPVSDYFLRIYPGYRSASKGAEAARFDLVVARAHSATDARIVFYAWCRARASIDVAQQALADQRTHLSDAQTLFDVGQVTLADVLRARTGVANGELGLTDAQSAAAILERQVRTAIHAPDDEPLAPAEDLLSALPPLGEQVSALLAEARSSRVELRSLEASVAALRSQAKVARAARLPSLSLFADAIYANPNPRYLPAADKWLGTWDVGAQATWSPNEILIASAAGREAESKARQLENQRAGLRDAIDIEVERAYEDALRSDAAILSSDQALASAKEAYRVARAGFVVGRVTSTTLTDVETELTRARLDVVNARSNARIARAQLAFATGREAKRRVADHTFKAAE